MVTSRQSALRNGSSRFVISLDFELAWGIKDHRSLGGYRRNLLGVRSAVPGMLSLFRQYGIRATWAAVGMLFFENREQLVDSMPLLRPCYQKARLSNYELMADVGNDEESDPYHFAASLIRSIIDTPGQELATHTFSHYYCLERGQTRESFRADLRAAFQAAKRFGVQFRSIVFPRNQFNAKYLQTCADAGLIAYRGNAMHWLYRATTTVKDKRSLMKRGMRFVDSYLSISGTHVYSGQQISNGIINVPASRFLRPYSSRLKILEPIRLQRIERELEIAARNAMLYHLWWHPHNFGVNTLENLSFLERILEKVANLRDKYGMECPSMGELATRTLASSVVGTDCKC